MKMLKTVSCMGLGVLVLLCAGCAGMRGPSQEEQVMAQAKAFAADFQAVNADKILDYISESFTDERVPDKATLTGYLVMAKATGKIEEFKKLLAEYNGKIEFASARAKITGDTASVYPVAASADLGSVTVELTFKLDPDKVWRISGANVEGL